MYLAAGHARQGGGGCQLRAGPGGEAVAVDAVGDDERLPPKLRAQHSLHQERRWTIALLCDVAHTTYACPSKEHGKQVLSRWQHMSEGGGW